MKSLFCSVSQGSTAIVYMCLCWSVGMILSYFQSDKARTSKAISSFLCAQVFLLQSLNLPDITIHTAVNPCRLMPHLEQTDNLSKKFSLFFVILTFLSELKVQVRMLLFFLSYLTKQKAGFQKDLLLKTLSQGIDKLALITLHLLAIIVKVNGPLNITIKKTHKTPFKWFVTFPPTYHQYRKTKNGFSLMLSCGFLLN